jgi:hypothetical protein
MNGGRWYPSALALPDGGARAISGSFAQGRPQPPPDNPVPPPPGTQFPTNPNPQIWRNGVWTPTMNFQTLQLFPRLHIEPKQGHVFMSGPQGQVVLSGYRRSRHLDSWSYSRRRATGLCPFRDVRQRRPQVWQLRARSAQPRDSVSGDIAEAQKSAATAERLARERLQLVLMADARAQSCRLFIQRSLLDQAAAACQSAGETYKDAGDRNGSATNDAYLAAVKFDQGDVAGARRLYKQALQTHEEIGSSV